MDEVKEQNENKSSQSQDLRGKKQWVKGNVDEKKKESRPERETR